MSVSRAAPLPGAVTGTMQDHTRKPRRIPYRTFKLIAAAQQVFGNG
jgi:hypothetical protein